MVLVVTGLFVAADGELGAHPKFLSGEFNAAR